MNRLLPWLLNLLWGGVLLAVSPVLLYRTLRHGKYRHSWRQRLLGELPQLPQDSTGPRFWFHAVSVGEVLLLETVLDELAKRDPQAEIVISVTTHTGLDVARRKFPEHTICCFPLDFSWAVRRAIRRIQPTRIVLVELELWPNFILEAARAGVPLSLINGRLSERSFRGYSKAGWLMRRLISSFDQLAVQSDEYARRFIKLGATPDRVIVTGSVKFDRVATDRENPQTQALRAAFGLKSHESVFVAGSTVAPEENVALEAWQEVRRQHPKLRLILVPRHKERFEEVAQLVESRNLNLLRRSQSTSESDSARSPLGEAGADQSLSVEAFLNDGLPPESPPVILLDTLGELSACWGLADFAFVGGSLANRGGQNMIEPAGYGAALCFGPDTRNFRDVVVALLKRDAAKVVEDSIDLEETLLTWLANRDAARAQGIRAKEFVLSQHGATTKTIDCLLGETEPARLAHRAA
ncbi:MAG: 3-deoxy-D-manno-octulosonic acid transferase [Planctomycetota bacterium]|nr:3-deoxy-D-manno-octulosonic acid transferase [Planctomycetota bacterium]MDA1249215.1 3-deoxy-D-manno-octulosonic acid transferase [Planctomycetota bacterium]